MSFDVVTSFRLALTVLSANRDIVDGRVTTPDIPGWCASRNWEPFLLGLHDHVLEQCEEQGLANCLTELGDAPKSLQNLSEQISTATKIPSRAGTQTASIDVRSIPLRKRAQLTALLGLCAPLAARASRIVEVAAGRGHFLRLSSQVWSLPGIGFDREATRVETAQQLAIHHPVRFHVLDALGEDLALESGDLLVGLHPCGEVGDRLVSAAAQAGIPVALVSCCLQKTREPERKAQSQMGLAAGLTLSRRVLGLTNLCATPNGVEAPLRVTMEARMVRHALRLLLLQRGIDVSPGAEMRGLNRRQPQRGLAHVAERALLKRGLAPPRSQELETCLSQARREFAIIRRLSLPRSMLARLLEVVVVLDRALFLHEQGFQVEVLVPFGAEISPRNLLILGRPDSER